MKKILITGADSYVGTQVEQYLSRFPGQYRVETVDVRNGAWKEASFGGFDAVLHVAGIVHQKQTKDDPAFAEQYHRVNALLPLEVAQKAKEEGVRQFLFMSTQGVYGCRPKVGSTLVIDENTLLEPRDNYGRSKLEAEQHLKYLADDQFRLVILRPPMIYGKGCKGNYVALAKLARCTPVFPKVANLHSMLYIENFGECVRQIIDHCWAGILCPQDEEYVDAGVMVQKIAKAHGRKLLLIPGFSFALKALGRQVGAANKVFGGMVYARELSGLPWGYWVKNLDEAIQETEG